MWDESREDLWISDLSQIRKFARWFATQIMEPVANHRQTNVPRNYKKDLSERQVDSRMKLITAAAISSTPLCVTLKILFFVSSLSQYTITCCRFALIFFRFHIRILSSENNAFVLCDARSIGFPRPHQAQRASNAFLLNFVFFPRLVCVQRIRWKM